MTAEAVAAPVLVTEPGTYTIPEGDYHLDPVPGRSLSFSGAKRLLPPSCPAIFHHERQHGRPDKRAFDFGHAAHSAVLGVGAPVVVVQKVAKDGTKSDATDYRTKSAQDHCEAIRAQGSVPLLADEVAQVAGMAKALRLHPIASALLDPEHGKAEQSIFWRDERHDVWRRSRLDWLPEPRNGRLIVTDYKTCLSASPESIAKNVYDYRYHMQHPWYVDGVKELGLADDVGFVFIFQDKNAPYLVTVVELDADAVAIGRGLNDRALEVYAECSATDTWPGYTDDIELISLPGWALNRHQELLP